MASGPPLPSPPPLCFLLLLLLLRMGGRAAGGGRRATITPHTTRAHARTRTHTHTSHLCAPLSCKSHARSPPKYANMASPAVRQTPDTIIVGPGVQSGRVRFDCASSRLSKPSSAYHLNLVSLCLTIWGLGELFVLFLVDFPHQQSLSSPASSSSSSSKS